MRTTSISSSSRLCWRTVAVESFRLVLDNPLIWHQAVSGMYQPIKDRKEPSAYLFVGRGYYLREDSFRDADDV